MVLYILVPVVVAQLWRRRLLDGSRTGALTAVLTHLQPVSLGALLFTLVLLFGFQGEQILQQPAIIVMLAVPILIQVYFNSSLAYWLNRRLGVAYRVACPSALIGASATSSSSPSQWPSACSGSSRGPRWRRSSAC